MNECNYKHERRRRWASFTTLKFNQLSMIYYFLRFSRRHFPALRIAFIVTFAHGNGNGEGVFLITNYELQINS